MDGTQLPELKTALPGPNSQAWVSRLANTECPAITARRARRESETGVPQDPIVWAEAKGANVKDVDGNVFVDLTGAFAVSGPGHRQDAVVEALQSQSSRLIHAMGDVYPSDIKIEFCERLAQVTPAGLNKSILGMSGADAITAALKTAAIYTGKPGVIAFTGGYHGLSYGALSVTAYRNSFREPFLQQLNPHVRFVPYPDPYRPPFGMEQARDSHSDEDVRDAVLAHIRSMLSHPASGAEGIGAIIVEPIQGRGGEVVPPEGFLAGLREICDAHGLVLIFDEIFTGFGRTGALFACEHEGVTPDILCLGKAMGGGVPLSAAVGTDEVMDGWGNSSGESIHTSTFLGNPLSCAMGLAAINEIVEGGWSEHANSFGATMRDDLDALRDHPNVGDIRGRGMMIGIDLVVDKTTREPNGALALSLMAKMRNLGFLILPSGSHGNVVALSPPFGLTMPQWEAGLNALKSCMTE